MNEIKHKGRSVAVFDIDGTFARGSLFIHITKALCDQNIFPVHSFFGKQKIARSKSKWENREASYENYVEEVVDFFFANIRGVEQYQMQELSRVVVRKYYKQIYVFTRELFKIAQESYCTIAITGSQFEMVSAFQKYWPFDVILSKELEAKYGVYTGNILSDPFKDKRKALLDVMAAHHLIIASSLGVGDTEGDVGVLKEVNIPICFNPNHLLYEEAKKFGWMVVIERKNLIMVLHDHNKPPDFLNAHRVDEVNLYIRDLLKSNTPSN